MSATLPTPSRLALQFGDMPMGQLLFRESDRTYAVELAEPFLRSRHEIAPIIYPFLDAFRFGLVEYHGEPGATSPFAGGLPGFLADSLPDKWGETLAQIEDPARAATLMGMFSRVGGGGQGAIVFTIPDAPTVVAVQSQEDLAELATRANRLYKRIGGARVRTAPLSAGGSLGGIFPKAVVHLPANACAGGVVAAPQILVGGDTPADSAPGIVKFSPVPDDEDQGAVEFAFHEMAKAAGLRLPAACLLVDGAGIRHFAVTRFDRIRRQDGTFKRLHVQSLSALLHRRPVGDIRYEELIVLASRLGGPLEAREAFRRVIFNLLSTNRDDHGRNHAFLYDPEVRLWKLAPAYDLNPNFSETLEAIRWGDGTELPTRFTELIALARIGGISEAQAMETFEEVDAAIEQWPQFATAAGVRPEITKIWAEGIFSATKQGGPLRADARAYLLGKQQRRRAKRSSTKG